MFSFSFLFHLISFYLVSSRFLILCLTNVARDTFARNAQRRVYRVTWGPFLGVTIYRSRSRVTGHIAPLQDKRDFLSYADSRVMVSQQTATENIADVRNFCTGICVTRYVMRLRFQDVWQPNEFAQSVSSVQWQHRMRRMLRSSSPRFDSSFFRFFFRNASDTAMTVDSAFNEF